MSPFCALSPNLSRPDELQPNDLVVFVPLSHGLRAPIEFIVAAAGVHAGELLALPVGRQAGLLRSTRRRARETRSENVMP